MTSLAPAPPLVFDNIPPAHATPVEHTGEPVDHAGQAGDDVPELVESAAAAELLGVMRNRLEAQDAFAFGVGLERQESV